VGERVVRLGCRVVQLLNPFEPQTATRMSREPFDLESSIQSVSPVPFVAPSPAGSPLRIAPRPAAMRIHRRPLHQQRSHRCHPPALFAASSSRLTLHTPRPTAQPVHVQVPARCPRQGAAVAARLRRYTPQSPPLPRLPPPRPMASRVYLCTCKVNERASRAVSLDSLCSRARTCPVSFTTW